MDDPAAVLRASTPSSVRPPSEVAGEAAARAPAAGAHSGSVVPPAVVAPTVAGAVAGGCGTQAFFVELRPGETTIVSWKKLLKEAGLGAALPPPLPAAAAVQPVVGLLAGTSGALRPTENDPNDPSQSDRFNAVIEKIECLYMGKHSSDEEDLDDVPDDDQYDTEDSFIDEVFKDKYFEVDNLATKHTGHFVNRGKLERSEYGSVQTVEPDGSVQNVEQKKRRRRDSSSSHVENNQEFAQGSMPVKSPKRSALQIGKNLATSNLSSYSKYHSEDNRPVKSKSNSPGRTQKMNSSDNATGAEYGSYLKISSKDVMLPSSGIKDFDKHKTAAPQVVDFVQKSRTSDTYDHPYPAYLAKDAPLRCDLQLKRTFNVANQDLTNKMRRKEKYGVSQFSGLTTTSDVYPTQITLLDMDSRMEGSGTKAKGTRLERAIRDLQNRPHTLDVHDVDPNCQAAVKRRLPQEVKQKLAKVARLSANQGKIPEDELVNRLMGIVGHLVQRRTLKRNMKEMVESGLYAKQEKADKFWQVEIEIYEMIRARLATKPKGVVDIDERRAFKGNFVMDAALEDRICDLYDLYVEGMDEDKGPQSRKLYIEARNEERMKKRRLAAATKLRDGNPPVVAQYATAQQVIQPPMKGTQPSMTSTHTVYPVVNYGHNQASRIADKAGEMSVGAVSDGNRSSCTEIKRKPGSDAVDLQANPLKAPLHHGREKQKPAKGADEAKVSSLPQMVLAVPGNEQRPSYS